MAELLKAILERSLKCPTCQQRYSNNNLPKIIPDCGKSICASCEKELKSNMNLNRNKEFNCKACGEIHQMPKDDLEINEIVIKKLKNLELEQMNEAINLDELRNKLEELNTNCNQFKSTLDRKEQEIKVYCNLIRNEIKICKDNRIEEINEEFKQLMNEIDKHEREQIRLLNANEIENKGFNLTLNEINEFSKNCRKSLNENKINNKEQIENEIKKLNEFNVKLEKNLKQLKNKQKQIDNLKFNESKEKKRVILGNLEFKHFNNVSSM